MTTYFTPALFKYLHELKANNTREWFAANKARYEQVARNPMLCFIKDLQPVFNKIAPHVMADPRPVGGSMFRINRDIRFSKDKSPYKTAIAPISATKVSARTSARRDSICTLNRERCS